MSKPFRPIPWSYSMLTAFEQCPLKFKLTKVTKEVTEDFGPEAGVGIKVHKALELAALGQQALPPDLQQHQGVVDKIRATPGQKLYEYKFGLTQNLQPTTFFASDVWVRGALDVCIVRPKVAVILDYKTGKRKLDIDQLKLFAGAAFALFPHIEKAKTGYIWLKENKPDQDTFTRESSPAIWQEFAMRVHRLEHAVANDKFPPNPSGLCKKHCPVGRHRCDHCGV